MNRLGTACMMVGWISCFAGCGGGESVESCAGLVNPCAVAGERRCGPNGASVETCVAAADGCTAWAPAEQCGTEQACQAAGGSASCGCPDACMLGTGECAGTVVRTCVEVNGCRVLATQQDCAALDPPRACDDSSGMPACVATCGEACADEGASRCRGDVVETCVQSGPACLEWQASEDCTVGSALRVCDDSAGPAACVLACAGECEIEGETRCAGVLQVCALAGDGCLHWTLADACDGVDEYCGGDDEAAVCLTCAHECEAVGDVGCEGSVVSACTEDEHGCRVLVAAEDCITLTPTHECAIVDGAATCVLNQGEGTCADPLLMGSRHERFMGVDFSATFFDGVAPAGAGCRLRTGSREAVFAVDLPAGELLSVRELGGLDVVISVQRTSCGSAVACATSVDTPESLTYYAAAAERVYVIVESGTATPAVRDYDIRLDLVETELCSGGVDEDANGLTDCADYHCYGHPPCVVEADCGDGVDNDDDGGRDCGDSDCAFTGCARRGVYSALDPGDGILESASAAFSRSWVPSFYGAGFGGSSCAIDFDHMPGSPAIYGDGVTTELQLGDDDAQLYTLSYAPSVQLFERTYTAFWVGSNGFITFDGPDTTASVNVADFFAHDRIAVLDVDLDPGAAPDARIVVDETEEAVYVTWLDVPFKQGGGAVSMQLTLWTTEASFHMDWPRVDQSGVGWVGVASALGDGPFPAEASFALHASWQPRSYGDLIFSEVLWDPAASSAWAGQYVEVYNPTDRALSLTCCQVRTDLFNYASFGSLTIEPGGHRVMVDDLDPALNGGIVDASSLDGAYFGGPDATPINLTCNQTLMDRLPFGDDVAPEPDPWPAGGDGVSMQLRAGFLDADANDEAEAWCDSSALFGHGDRGTPGSANPECTGVVTILAEDFEADPMWTKTGDWEWGRAVSTYASYPGPGSCYAGTGCYGTDLSYYYTANRTYATNYLQLGPIDLSTVSTPSLHFRFWLQTATADYATVQVSTDGSSFATLALAHPDYTAGTEWTGNVATSWMSAWADLSPYAGASTVYLRWALRSDATTQRPGFYIDNLSITEP